MGYIIPVGTKQETGADLFLKKTESKKVIKDAKLNNKADLKEKKNNN